MISLKSKISQAVLGHFFLHDDHKLYAGEMVKMLNVDKRNLAKKLHEIVNEGLLTSERQGHEVYYRLNKEYPLFNEYKKIILKTYGIERQLRLAIEKMDGIAEAYIFGSYAKNTMDGKSDIDVLIVGDAKSIDIHAGIVPIQKSTSREINIVNMTKREFQRKCKEKDPFINEIMKGHRIRLK